jgi:hypothetical protein
MVCGPLAAMRIGTATVRSARKMRMLAAMIVKAKRA